MTSWEHMNNLRLTLEKKYSSVMLTALRKQVKPFLDEINRTNAENIDLNTMITDEEIRKAYIKLYIGSGTKFLSDVTRQFDQLRKDLQMDLWEEEMLRYVEELAGARIIDVTNYSKELIQAAIKRNIEQGVSEGLSTFEIMKNLRTDITKGAYNQFTKARALRIARTEIMTASNAASFAAADASGFPMQKVWITAPVGIAKKERHNAIGMNGQIRMMHEDFDVDGAPMSMPGDSRGGAQNVINCNCGLTYKVI